MQYAALAKWHIFCSCELHNHNYTFMRAVDYFMNDLLYYKLIVHAKIGNTLNETCLVTSLIPTRNGL